MRIAYLDCVGGISGDMFVGALLDAGWAEEAFRAGVAWLADEIVELRVEIRRDRSFVGRGIVVVPAAKGAARPAGSRTADPHPAHRRLADVVALVEGSPLPAPVISRACAVFERLAAAEARAHGRALAEVRFHEVGAVDAIIDVTSACLGLHQLGVERLFVSPVPLGSGRVASAHGAIPLPAPATAFILEGAPVRWTEALGERCTPTGAALIATLGDWGIPPRMRLERVGCGAGTRQLEDMPNIARLFVGTDESGAPEGAGSGSGVLAHAVPPWGWAPPSEPWAAADRRASPEECPGSWAQIVVLRAQIDDATAEELGQLVGRLRAAGALEVYQTAVSMKKDRLGTEISVFARPGEDRHLAAILLRESPTLGVRWRREWRRELLRKEVLVSTKFGSVPAKLSWRGDRWLGKPEADACRRLADAAGVPYAEVWRAALAEVERLSTAEPHATREDA